MNKRSDYVIRNRNKKNNKFSKKKNIIVASTLSVVCIAAMAGIYKMEKTQNGADEPLVNWEDTASIDTSDKINVNMSSKADKVSDDGADVAANSAGIEDNFGAETQSLEEKFANATNALDEQDSAAEQTTAENVGGSANDVADSSKSDTALAQTAAKNSVALSFGQNDSLTWPVEGNILLDYSMDSTIYFPTLDQYKYNPAIVIQAEEGCSVKAAAKGVVDSIEKSDETGLTVTMDIGGGYKLIYGQLKDVNYSTGSVVEKGETVGVVAAPTKYYSIEGSNLYFELLNNEVPTNPVEFLTDGVVTD